MLRILFIAVLFIPAAGAQERAEFTKSEQSAAQAPEQFTFEIRFISSTERLLDQFPKESITEISALQPREPFEGWDQQPPFEKTGTPTVLIGQPTSQVRPTEPTRVATLDDDQMFRLIQSIQGDTRSNIMTAPKVTVFRDQVGTIEDCTRTPLQTAEGSNAVRQELLNGTHVHVRVTAKDDGSFWADSEIRLHSVDPVQQTNPSEPAAKRPTRQMTDTFRLSHQINDATRTVVIIPPASDLAEEPPKPKIRLAGFRKPAPAQPRRMLIAITARQAFAAEFPSSNSSDSN